MFTICHKHPEPQSHAEQTEGFRDAYCHLSFGEGLNGRCIPMGPSQLRCDPVFTIRETLYLRQSISPEHKTDVEVFRDAGVFRTRDGCRVVRG